MSAFHRMDERLWTTIPAAAGWSFFFANSVTIPLHLSEPIEVAFYNPWYDAFLATRWASSKQGCQLADAELLMGDWIRHAGRSTISAAPFWNRDHVDKPTAVGVAVAHSSKSLEELANARAGDGFRAYVPKLDDAGYLEYNYASAVVAVLDCVQRLLTYHDDDHRPLRALRKSVDALLREGAAGRGQAILERAAGTMAPMRTLFAAIPPETFPVLTVTDHLLDDTSAVVFLQPPMNSAFCVAFTFARTREAFELQRVDVVSYPAYYGALYHNGPETRPAPADPLEGGS